MSLSARRAWIEIAPCWRVSGCSLSLSARRAWIEILVPPRYFVGVLSSLSARRAWIEIANATHVSSFEVVALRKESVDRNSILILRLQIGPKSLSARRAWIEITTRIRMPTGCVVALRKESVDRNLLSGHLWSIPKCRSPQGERG